MVETRLKIILKGKDFNLLNRRVNSEVFNEWLPGTPEEHFLSLVMSNSQKTIEQ